VADPFIAFLANDTDENLGGSFLPAVPRKSDCVNLNDVLYRVAHVLWSVKTEGAQGGPERGIVVILEKIETIEEQDKRLERGRIDAPRVKSAGVA
jgi:hypothetical protein